MNIIVSIQGGLGKSVMATAFCRAIRNQYPNDTIIVLTAYPEVFSNSPVVNFVFGHSEETYFFSKYIENQNSLIFANEPYLVTEHIYRRESVAETFCKMNGVAFNGELPEIFINEREFNFFQNKYPSDKPIMVIQTNGGAAQSTDMKYSWARDIPRNVVNGVIEEFRSKYKIFHIRREDQLGYDHTTPIQDTFKGIACLIARSQKRLFMDSFGQHTAAALNKKSTVLWIANSPRVFGYSINDNILPNPETVRADLKYSLFGRYNIIGTPNEFPYRSESEIFDVDKVITSLVNQ
jgi:hypothetical protein